MINETLRVEEGKCTQAPPLSSIRTVVIDAGHGGRDPGCLGGSSQEKHIVLGIAQRFAAKLRDAYPDLEVILTRDEDVFIPLHRRAAIANRVRADLFISIHANFMPGSRATRGSETYVMGLHTADHNLNVAKRENAAILLETDYEANYDYDPNSDEGHILMAMVQSAFLDQSIMFAEQVERQLAAAGRKSRGVKQAGFVVLKETAMPSVLVESGFLSNRAEEAYLMSEDGQEEVANALLEAFRSYKQLIEGGDAAVSNIDEATLALVESVESSIPRYTRGPESANGPQQPETLDRASRPDQTPPTTYQFEEVSSNEVQQTNAVYRPPIAQPQDTATEPELLEPVQAAFTPTEESRLHARELPPRATTNERVVVPAAPGSLPERTTNSAAPAQVTASPAQVQHSQVATYEYCVQLAASESIITDADQRWAILGWPVSQIVEDGLYKYQLRSLGSAESSINMQNRVRENGLGQAFIVIYQNGQKLDPTTTRSLLAE
ncbi:MAG: N-acetylmuramoyl-L-alanine amidase [Bacteroidota bacterium]